MIAQTAVLMFWRSLALLCLGLGAAGVLVPLLPTTPFLLVAAWAGGKGWPQFEAWLVAHPRWGAPIRRWRDHRAVPRGAKWLASLAMAASAALLLASAAPLAVTAGVTFILVAVAAWLWRRPEI